MATSVKLDEELQARLDRLACARQRSAHGMMQEAVRQYVEREDARDGFRQAALESWREYQETGLYLTLDDAEAWLDTWGTEDEGETPACRKSS